MSKSKLLLTLIVVAAATRLVPHPPNFTALGALALFCGAYVSRPVLAVVAPMAAMLLGDIVLLGGLYGFDRFPYVLPSYACLGLTALLGLRLREPTVGGVGSYAVLSTLLFYLGTNLGVWWIGALYPRTLDGLVACYVAAIPFALNMLAANLLFSAVMFAVYERAVRRSSVAVESSQT